MSAISALGRSFRDGVRQGWIQAIEHGKTLPSVSHQIAFEDDMYFKLNDLTRSEHRPWGNPRSPEEAGREYYLVPAGMKLRYAPQYADLSFDVLVEAQVVREIMRKKYGIEYTIYDKDGAAL